MMQVFNTMVIIILQYINVSNQHTKCLKLIQYVNYLIKAGAESKITTGWLTTHMPSTKKCSEHTDSGLNWASCGYMESECSLKTYMQCRR